MKRGKTRVHVVIVPTSRAELFPALSSGKVDMVAAMVTVSPGRERLVAFSEPTRIDVSQVVVTGPGAPPIRTVDDLAGQEVFVRKGSSYDDSLVALNARLTARGKPPVIITPAPDVLEDDDILEMVNAGLAPITVVDDYLAEFWSRVLHRDHGARERDREAAGRGGAVQEIRLAVQTRLPADGGAGLSGIHAGPERHESGGGHRHHAAHAADREGLNVGDSEMIRISRRREYMRVMMDQYFADEPMDDLNKALMTFASYNAGPNRVRQLRRETAERGLDPNVWFGNVERIASERIGRETVTYVSNIFKYYVAYRLIARQSARRDAAKAQAARAG